MDFGYSPRTQDLQQRLATMADRASAKEDALREGAGALLAPNRCTTKARYLANLFNLIDRHILLL